MLRWAAVIGPLIAFFYLADHVAKQEVKSKVARWLQNLLVQGSLSNWPAQFGAVFDGIFGERHFSWRCFWRSCVASIISVIVVIILIGKMRLQWAPEAPVEFLMERNVITLFILFGFINFVPDYFSLLETRYVLQ